MSVNVPDSIFKAYDVRGLYGDEITGDVAERIGRGFALTIAELSGKPTSELRLGLGRDMRLTAPELAGRYAAGMVAEGATVLDAGQVGTEQLYFLVGSQNLDGGLMCTASHNPKAYTGAKLVGEGALALSATPASRRSAASRSPTSPRRTPRRPAPSNRSTSPRASAPQRSSSSTPTRSTAR